MDVKSDNLVETENQSINKKSFLILILLTQFFGLLGAHRFYVGKKKSGLVQLSAIFWLGLTLIVQIFFGDDSYLATATFIPIIIIILWVGIDSLLVLSGSFKDTYGNVIGNHWFIKALGYFLGLFISKCPSCESKNTKNYEIIKSKVPKHPKKDGTPDKRHKNKAGLFPYLVTIQRYKKCNECEATWGQRDSKKVIFAN